MERIVSVVVASKKPPKKQSLCAKPVGWCAIGLYSDHENKEVKVVGMDGMKKESGFGMDITQDDLTLLLIAQHTRMRIVARLTTKHQTGYHIRCECDLFGREPIPDHVAKFLAEQGLPAQNRYTEISHLNRLLRLLKQHSSFTKDWEGFNAVALHIGSLPKVKHHNDVEKVLEVLDDVV